MTYPFETAINKETQYIACEKYRYLWRLRLRYAGAVALFLALVWVAKVLSGG